MALRNVVGSAARMSAGFWSEVARMTEPPKQRQDRERRDDPRQDPEQVRAERADAPAASPTASQSHPETVTDGVLVPLDTWTRVMDQLGHLHEAGQELAEARERAARAETQVEFLKEQLAAERRKAERRRPKPAASPAPTPEPAASAVDLTASRARVSAARDRVTTWISSRR